MRGAPAAKHAAPSRLRVSAIMASVLVVVLAVTGAIVGVLNTGGAVAATSTTSSDQDGPGVSIMKRMAQDYAGSSSAIALPAASAPPAPAPPSLANAPALNAHEIFGFAPYWALPQSSAFDVNGVTTLAYFSIGVNRNATLAENGPGWVGYQSQALADLVTRAHGAGDRVVLSVTCFDQSSLNQLSADPSSGGRLGAELVQLVSAKNLDGVNVDFEGSGSGDQKGLDHLMASLSAALHQADAHWQVTMDTYGSSAADPSGFYDIAGLAPSVDGFFVMAYDMGSRTDPSPTAPLSGPGFTDLRAVQEYSAVVPPSKVILGVPYYGYDWPTAGPGLGDPATGPPTPVSYAQVMATGGHVYWDPTTLTPWTSYQVGAQWHQACFDNPTSLALKAQLANTYHLAGVGIWAMGMDGGASALQAALRGDAPLIRTLPRGPGPSPSTTTTGAAATAYTYQGSWNGQPVTLTAVDPGDIATEPQQPAGALDAFSSDDPTVSCLTTGPPLAVVSLSSEPGLYAVLASTPGDCVAGAWEFDAAGGATPSPTTTTTSPPDPTPTSTTSTSTTSP
jgi:hypothetical protein